MLLILLSCHTIHGCDIIFLYQKRGTDDRNNMRKKRNCINENTRSVMRVITALLLCVSIFFSMMPSVSVESAASAENTLFEIRRHNSYKNIDKEINIVSDSYVTKDAKGSTGILKAGTDDLPSSYRSDEQPWAAGIKVKDQGSSGLCWAFSTTTAAEYSYAKEIYEKTGETGVVNETSPGHIGQFFYNRVNDPLGNTAGDHNGVIEGEYWPLYGGSHMFVFQFMATWSGLALESEAPIDSITSHIRNKRWDNSYLPYDNSLAYKDDMVIENCEGIFFSSFTDRTALRNKLKEMIWQYGAVATSITQEDDFFNTSEKKPNGSTYVSGRSFYNYTDPSDVNTNHAITIVGWDDDYPASNFTHRISGMSNSEAYALTTPGQNGAWIIQNSWGDDSHENGFYYASYESGEFSPDFNADAYSFDMQSADTYKYNFQYDGTADNGDSSDRGDGAFYTRRNTKAANIYTNTTGNPILLDAVGFSTFNSGLTNYTIQVYTDLTDTNNPTSGTLACTTVCSTNMLGCKTAVLSNSVPIAPDETFSIVFSFSSDTYFCVEKSVENTICNFTVQTDPGQSFFCAARSTKWTDMDQYDACFRIKGFANIDQAAMPSPTPTVEPTATPTVSPSPTPTATPVATPSPSPTPTATPTASPSPTPTATPTATQTASPSPAPTAIPTATPTPTPTVTASPSPAPIATPAASPDPTAIPTVPTETPAAEPTSSPTARPADISPTPPVGNTADTSAAEKIENTLKVKGRLANIRYKKLLKKAKKLALRKVLAISDAPDDIQKTLTYSIVSVNKKKYKKYFKIDKNTGTFTVKKKLRKGLYKIKVTVTSDGNADYHSATRSATIKIRIR